MLELLATQSYCSAYPVHELPGVLHVCVVDPTSNADFAPAPRGNGHELPESKAVVLRTWGCLPDLGKMKMNSDVALKQTIEAIHATRHHNFNF